MRGLVLPPARLSDGRARMILHIIAWLVAHGWTCFWTGVHRSAFYCLNEARLP